jgi:hypothetical protein
MDANVRPYLDAFFIAVFPVLQVYLVLLIKAQIDKLHQSNQAVNGKVDQIINTQADVAHTLEVATEAATVPTPNIPAAKGK